MKNWRYRVDDENFILTPREHEYLKSLIKRGEKGIVYLRDETLQINLAYVKYARETDQMTIQQELGLFKTRQAEKQVNLLAGNTLKKMGHADFYEKMGWDYHDSIWEEIETSKAENSLKK